MTAEKGKATEETGVRAENGSGSRPFAGVIVAISASAAETDSLLRVLAGLPPDGGVAVVLAFQHREVLDEEGFRRALGERASALAAVVDGAPVETGRIYLPAPDLTVRIEGGRFRTEPAEESPGGRGTIDSLFASIAQDQDGSTIGVFLAGTGGDGTLGVLAIKEAGGLTLGEGTKETDALDLTASNTPLAIVDRVLPAGEIPGRIVLHARHLARLKEAAALEERAAEVSDALTQIVAVLRNSTGHDFHGYKRNTFLRRVQRRMQVVQADGIADYLEVLRTRPDEPQQLFNDLLIGVTQFFRDRREFEFLETRIIPKLFEGKTPGDQLRVWVLGCSTGEEAYSLAILLREHASRLDTTSQIQIFASDIDGRALAAARVGRYPQTIANHMSPERLARWFIKEGSTYRIAKELREMCVFSQHSIIKDAPFSRLDLVSCRNLLIYLSPDLQSRVIPLFHFALKPDGFLFLGNAENVSHHPELFAPVDRGFRIFQKRETGSRLVPDFPFTIPHRRTADIHIPQPRPRIVAEGLARHAERLAERYAPAYAIVDESFDVLHFSARAGLFIHPAGGVASLNLLSLIHSDLRMDLRGALDRAALENSTVEAHGLQMGANGQRVAVELVVEPVQEAPNARRAFVVLFKDGVIVADAGSSLPNALTPLDEHGRRLEAELRVTRERLQATIEELESTNEELKSSNEEYQSLNEELQSANEELETSKEELQSVNEELTTVNGELAHRVQELARVNSDLKNLLESTQIATVFLDNDLRVMNYTPAAAQIFHLVETDVGRPIGHIKSRIEYGELQDDVRRVVRTLGSIDREVESLATHARYIARVLPYRNTDDFIAGAVVTFTDVTALTRAQRALRESETDLRLQREFLDTLIRQAPVGISIAEAPSGRVIALNDRARALLGQGEPGSRVNHNHIYNATRPDGRPHAVEEYPTVRALRDGEVIEREEVIYSRGGDSGKESASTRRFEVSTAPVRDEADKIVAVVTVFYDIEERRRTEEDLRNLNDTLEARVAERTAELMAAEETLRQAQKMETVGQLTGGLAHDFNNMLQGIYGSVELTRRRMEQGQMEGAKHFADTALKTVERAAALTNRLLAFARRQTLQPRTIDPREMVEGMVDLIRRTVGPRVDVELRMGENVWTVLCDPNQLESVLLNLAINASDAMPESGTLTISTANKVLSDADVAGHDGALPGDYVKIAVSDTGVGMEPDVAARAFEPFFTTKPLGQGTGLGLSQLYGFVRQSGGIVRLESAPGRGTTVRVYLPRHEPTQGLDEGAPPGADMEATGAGEAVLLVEDEADARTAAAERLRELGYKVLECSDGPTALDLLRSGVRVDLLVTDVGLPSGLNGRQVAEAARESRPDLPVLFITGYAGRALEGRLAAGMQLIGKPFSLDALAARVRSMLGAPSRG